jgi:hypothetical protein
MMVNMCLLGNPDNTKRSDPVTVEPIEFSDKTIID